MEDKLLYHHIPVASLASDQVPNYAKLPLHAFSNHQANYYCARILLLVV